MGEQARSDYGDPGFSRLQLVPPYAESNPGAFDLNDLRGQVLPEFQVDMSYLEGLLRDTRHTTLTERTSAMAHYYFEGFFGKVADKSDLIPTQKELEQEYFRFATYLHVVRHHSDVEILRETIDKSVEPYRDISPLRTAEHVAAVQKIFEEPHISELMVKLWIIDHQQIDIPSQFEELRKASQLTGRRSGFRT